MDEEYGSFDGGGRYEGLRVNRVNKVVKVDNVLRVAKIIRVNKVLIKHSTLNIQ